MFGRSLIRTLAVVAAVTALPVTALAAGPDEGKPTAAEGVRGKGKGDREAHQFPMKGGDFIGMVEKRITKVREKVQEKMARRDLTDAQRKQILAEVDAGAAKVRAAANKAAADGTVTKEEAKQVRDVAHDVKKEIREKHGMKDHKKGRGKGKDKGKV